MPHDTAPTFAPPTFFYEDVRLGLVVPFGRYAVTKEEIVAYARAFDPQPLHLDEEAAKATMIGRLCASGWHTCAMLMRMLADEVLNKSSSLGSPGMEEVRFLKPVFPGDVLTGRYTCLEQRVMRSRPHVGICRVLIEAVNQHGEAVVSWDTQQLFGLRDPAAAQPAAPAAAPAKPEAASPPATPSADIPAGDPEGNYFEDLPIGHKVIVGQHTFGRAEMLDFARKYDPQPFHLDEAAARRSLFGSVSASGWHTSAIWLRHVLDHRKRIAERMEFRGQRPARWGPSPGFGNIRWLKPVLVGDTLTFSTLVADKTPSKSRPGVGLVQADNEAVNQKGEVVFQVRSKMFVERRGA